MKIRKALVLASFTVLVVFPFAWARAVVVSIDVNPASYAGNWAIPDATPSNFDSGFRTVSIDSGTGIRVLVGNAGEFLIDITVGGMVSVLKPAAATGGSNILTFNTTPVTIDADAYLGTWSILGVTIAPAFVAGLATIDLVPGLDQCSVCSPGSYLIVIGNTDSGQIAFDLEPPNTLILHNPSGTATINNLAPIPILTFEVVSVHIEPGAFLGDWGIAGVRPSAPGLDDVLLVPGLFKFGGGHYSVSMGFGSFSITVEVDGTVAPNSSNGDSDAAIGGVGTLTFNTFPIPIDPGDFVGTWRILSVTASVTGAQTFDLVGAAPGIQRRVAYQLQASLGPSSEIGQFEVDAPCEVSPSSLVLFGETFTLTCPGAPVAIAGTSLDANFELQLDGSLSFDPTPTGAGLTFSWQIVGEATPRVGQPASIADLGVDDYEVDLTVSDGVQSSTDTILFGVPDTGSDFCREIDPIEGIDEAISEINALGLDPGIATSLIQKLQEAKGKFILGDSVDARSKVSSFVSEVEAAVSAGALANTDANILLNRAGAILAAITF